MVQVLALFPFFQTDFNHKHNGARQRCVPMGPVTLALAACPDGHPCRHAARHARALASCCETRIPLYLHTGDVDCMASALVVLHGVPPVAWLQAAAHDCALVAAAGHGRAHAVHHAAPAAGVVHTHVRK